tara:strand:+ start:105 stop:1181 length:1077 start_codon:yes stop_codon:yes gene_type:complete
MVNKIDPRQFDSRRSEYAKENEAKTTSTGKKETDSPKSPKIAKVLSYPLARRNEAPTDYLQIEIAEYDPAGLKLPAFTDKNKRTADTEGFNINTIESVEGSFALSRGSQTNNFKRKNKQIKNIINLPIPRNVTDSQGVQYGEGSLNPLEAFGVATVNSAITSTPSIDGIKRAFNKIAEAGGRTVSDELDQRAIAGAISGTAIGALGGNVDANQLIARASGQILNPNLELLFNGVGLRTFPLSFQFFPRNKQEGTVVMNIIRTLKLEMAPSRTTKSENGVFIKQPSIFQLTYKTGSENHKFLNRFLPAVLSDMKVNYSASGTFSAFYDGTPTHMQVDLQFKELNPIFREDYDNVGGVGY